MTASDTAGEHHLPHWERLPDDVPAAIAELKSAVRSRLSQLGTSATEAVQTLERFLADELSEIQDAVSSRGSAIPAVTFDEVASGSISPETIALIRRRGCVVIRSTFAESDAVSWDQRLLDYVESNGFFEAYDGVADDFFGTLPQGRPEIFPIYWSRSQMEARQHPHMTVVQRFLNRLWTYESGGRHWFDPDRNLIYPDRVRRRPPGTNSSGLSDHLDPGALDLWMTKGYQEHFRHLWNGEPLAHDPWDAAFRTEATHFDGSRMCSAFRSFQGWTALSAMRNDQGVLHTVPITKAISYLMMRPMLDDVDETDLCGVRHNRAFPANGPWHQWLLEARSPIPDVLPGDTVWWHADLIHSVGAVDNQEGWGNVMYIPAAPWCPPNERYASTVLASLRAGHSPDDFPADHYEETWTDRFDADDLNDDGRAGVGL